MLCYITGTFPNISRNAIVNVSEIVCYDVIKDTLIYYSLMKDGVPLHFTSAVIAGTQIITFHHTYLHEPFILSSICVITGCTNCLSVNGQVFVLL